MLFLLLQHSAHMKDRRKLTTPAPQEKLISASSVLSPDNARPLTLSLCQLVNSSADVNKQQACLTPYPKRTLHLEHSIIPGGWDIGYQY